MLVLFEKIAPTHRPQIFNDYASQDAAMARQAEDERWVKHLIEALGGTLRRIWK